MLLVLLAPTYLLAEIIADPAKASYIDRQYCWNACVGQPCGHKIPDPNDSTGYFICYGDIIKQVHCALGEVYDVKTQLCVPGTCPPCSCDNCSDGTTPTTPPPDSTNGTTPSDREPDCQNVENGHRFPDQIHCRFFWQCVSGRAVHLFCERGMWYDRERYVCNFPALVKNCPANQN